MNEDILLIDREADPAGMPASAGHSSPLPHWDDDLLILSSGDGPGQRWRLAERSGEAVLALEQDIGGGEADRLHAIAAFAAGLAAAGDPAHLAVDLTAPLRNRFHRDGVLRPDEAGTWRVDASALYQLPDLWLCTAGEGYGVFPASYTVTNGRHHPRRPFAQSGILYARHIPWLDQTLSLRLLDIDRDLAQFHRWQNDPRIAEFWLEAGDLDHHRQYLEAQLADPHTMPLIASLDGRPFGYFEVYWAKENRIGPHCDADDYDRGWHVLIGEADIRGRDYITAWMPSIVHYIFLSDPRTRRVVGEPAANHQQQIRNLDRGGFGKVREFDFPHKRALLVSLSRARFFAERLWVPRT